jgi:Family of unknown function (DUF5317)
VLAKPSRDRDAYPRVMLTALIVAVIAGLLGLLFGGSLEALVATRVRWLWLVYLGFAMQLVALAWSPEWLDGRSELALLLATNAPITAFMALNFRLPGMLLAGIGLALNLLVISANGAMPVATGAATGIERSVEDAGAKHEWLDDSTALPWLADVIPVPPIRTILSLGDVLLITGVAYFVWAQMTRSRSRGRHSISNAQH